MFTFKNVRTVGNTITTGTPVFEVEDQKFVLVTAGAMACVTVYGGKLITVSKHLVEGLSEEELSFLIGHEDAHVELGHLEGITGLVLRMEHEKSADRLAVDRSGVTPEVAARTLKKVARLQWSYLSQEVRKAKKPLVVKVISYPVLWAYSQYLYWTSVNPRVKALTHTAA